MTGRFGKADSFRKVATRLMPVFGVAFAAAFVLCSVFATSTITSAIGEEPSNDGYYVLIKSSDVTLDVLSVPTGAMTVVSSTVKTTTNNPYGYTLYLGMSPEDSEGNEKSAADKLKNGLYEDEDLTSTNLVSAVNATGSDPKPLDINNWGYAVDTATTGAPESWAGLTHTAMLNSAPTDDKFAAVPAVGSEEKLQSTSTPNTNIAEEDWQESYWDDSTKYTAANVWYGINANTNLPDGAYSNTIAYTAVANPQPTVYTLNYAPGTPDTVTGLPTTQTVTEASASHTFTISANIPERTGFAFAGYTDGVNTYQPRDTITVASTSQFVGTATLTAQWQALCTANTICYKSNEPAGTVSGTMTDQNIVYMTNSTTSGQVDTTALSSSTTQLTLYSSNWILSGYGFKGWNTAADGSGTPYGPNETINLTAAQQTELGTSGIMLYAQWVQSAGDMDTFSCSSLVNIGDVTALTYKGNTYAVAKLADNKCWMIENYRLDDPSSTSETYTGTKTTTFSTSEYNLRQYNVTNIDGSDGAYPINLTSPAGASSTTNQYQWKSYGDYYSWASAIKTTSTSSSQYYNWNGTSFSDSTSAVTQGICPSGWRLPRSYAGSSTNNPESDFRYLNSLINNGSWSSVSTAEASNNWRKYPNNFVFAGRWYSSSSYDRGTYGYYWSSTVYNSSLAYNLLFGSTSVYPANSSGKYNGRSVRCVASS
ncbi:hypothetical protein J6S39_00480 [Candidatus Saccharibacteria bacterium]|nr:hypothetical protein [Candidatus Saccharibacteria bacterium]